MQGLHRTFGAPPSDASALSKWTTSVNKHVASSGANSDQVRDIWRDKDFLKSMKTAAFQTGFIKQACSVGLNETDARRLLKRAEERKEYKLPHGESSFIGRYMADNAMDRAIFNNKETMLNKMDPDGSRFSKNWVLHQPELTEQRGHAAKMVPSTLAREAGRNIGSDMGISGILGGLLGTYVGARNAPNDWGSYAIGGGAGAAAGAGLAGAYNLWSKYRKSKVKQEDVDKTLARKKNNSLLKEMTPFSSLYDAATPVK